MTLFELEKDSSEHLFPIYRGKVISPKAAQVWSSSSSPVLAMNCVATQLSSLAS